MRVSRDFPGYSLGPTDILCRSMRKKKTSKKTEYMELEKRVFIEGTKQNDVPEGTAVNVFDHTPTIARYR